MIVGITRVRMRIGLVTVVTNMRHFLFLKKINAAAQQPGASTFDFVTDPVPKSGLKTINQNAINLKSGKISINERFFDPSTQFIKN